MSRWCQGVRWWCPSWCPVVVSWCHGRERATGGGVLPGVRWLCGVPWGVIGPPVIAIITISSPSIPTCNIALGRERATGGGVLPGVRWLCWLCGGAWKCDRLTAPFTNVVTIVFTMVVTIIFTSISNITIISTSISPLSPLSPLASRISNIMQRSSARAASRRPPFCHCRCAPSAALRRRPR